MLMHKQSIVALSLALGLSALAGCGSRETGPADPSKVPTVDPAVVEKELNREESKKYLPKGANIPKGVMPADPPSK